MSEKEAGSVVTAENAADFYAQKLGLADKPEAEAVQTEPVEEEQSEPDEEAKPVEERKQNPKLEKRFSELSKHRDQARQEAAQEREKSARLEARLADLERQKAPPTVTTSDAEPQPSQFTDAFEYAKALAQHSTEKALAQRDQAEAQRKVNEQRSKVLETWTTKIEAAKSKMPDFEAMVNSSDVVVGPDVRDAIMDSEVGPEILYHLAENPEVAKKISSLSVAGALRELGKLEARFEKTETRRETTVKSKASPPISPIRGAAGQADVGINANGEFHGTYQAWKEARRAGKIR